MRYPAPNYIRKPESTAAQTGIRICATIVLVIFLLVMVGSVVALAVGLGVGLTKNSDSDSNDIVITRSTSTTKTSSTTTISSIATSNSTSSKSCGTSVVQPTFDSKIINGHEATAHSWPWIVALYYRGSFRCGGALVSNFQYVLTAAHCVDDDDFNPSLMQVYAGLHSRSSLSDGQVRTVSNYKIHPNYVSTATYVNNDIAVLKLPSSFNSNDNVNLCCLPPSSSTIPSLNESAVIIGWGTTIAGVSSSISSKLLQAEIFIDGVSALCDASANPEVKFCAGYNGRDSCQGDSGGPLMTKINNTWACTGIVSYGISCGLGSGYYTRVANFRSFIDNTISSL